MPSVIERYLTVKQGIYPCFTYTTPIIHRIHFSVRKRIYIVEYRHHHTAVLEPLIPISQSSAPEPLEGVFLGFEHHRRVPIRLSNQKPRKIPYRASGSGAT